MRAKRSRARRSSRRAHSRPKTKRWPELCRQHVLKEQPTIKIAGLGGKKKPVHDVVHKN
jgi:hypothetical protein